MIYSSVQYTARRLSCDKKFSPQHHDWQIWARSSKHSDDRGIACPILNSRYHALSAADVHIVHPFGAGLFPDAIAQYRAPTRRKRQIYPLLVANKDKSEPDGCKYKAQKNAQIPEMPQLRQHIKGTERQGKASDNLPKMRREVCKEDITSAPNLFG